MSARKTSGPQPHDQGSFFHLFSAVVIDIIRLNESVTLVVTQHAHANSCKLGKQAYRQEFVVMIYVL